MELRARKQKSYVRGKSAENSELVKKLPQDGQWGQRKGLKVGYPRILSERNGCQKDHKEPIHKPWNDV